MGFQSIALDGTIHTTHGQTLWLTERALKNSSRVIFIGRHERLDQSTVQFPGNPIDRGDVTKESIRLLLQKTKNFLITDGEPPVGFDRSKFAEIRISKQHTETHEASAPDNSGT